MDNKFFSRTAYSDKYVLDNPYATEYSATGLPLFLLMVSQMNLVQLNCTNMKQEIIN